MTKIIPLSVLIFLVLYSKGSGETKCLLIQNPEKHAKTDSIGNNCQNVRIVFYNTENLFDPYEDTAKQDHEFTAKGIRHWTYSRFQVKLCHLAKTLIASGTREPPEIIGLCEVENRYVLNKLVYETPLKKFPYRILHRESPDPRGMDVALLVRKDRTQVLDNKFLTVIFPFDTTLRTRDILYAKLLLNKADTLHLFVNHWPSRLGDYQETHKKRIYVASVLRKAVDSIVAADRHPCILIMGDFNDGPEDESLLRVLGARPRFDPADTNGLVNLMWNKMHHPDEGTLKYRGEWNILDQFIVSGWLITGRGHIHTTEKDAHIFRPGFLLEPDDKFFGSKPSGTYSGPKYIGGFSDHLPVWLDIHCH